MIQSVHNTLLTPRVKTLPKGLIYKVPTKDCYRLIETKTGNLLGEMWAFASKNDKKIYNAPADARVYRVYSLEIDNLHRNKGWGTYFMDFAKNQSHKEGCFGRLYLIAYNPLSAPQIFYKKQGLFAVDKKVDKILDNCVKTNIRPMAHKACEMYLPLEEKSEKEKRVKKFSFCEYFKTLFGLNKK